MKLEFCQKCYYQVKKGQTLLEIARVFSLPPAYLAQRNALKEEVWAGQVLYIPPREGNLYAVQGGESKTLLCGSPENYEKRNGTGALYPTQIVLL